MSAHLLGWHPVAQARNFGVLLDSTCFSNLKSTDSSFEISPESNHLHSVKCPSSKTPSFHHLFPGWWMALATGLLSGLPTSILTPSKPTFSFLSLYLGQVLLPILHLLLYPFLPPNWSFPLDSANLAINQPQNGPVTHFWPLGFKVKSAESSWERISSLL